jgi:hypothetical protein
MANVNAPFGFRHVGLVGGVAPNFGLITRKIASNNATKIYQNDPVQMLATGYVAQWAAAVAVSQLVGVFQGCHYLSTSRGGIVWSPYWPGADATGDVTAYLQPCAGAAPATFLVQSSGTAIGFADIGANADVTIGTGSTLTGISGATLNQATLAVTATLPFRVVGLYEGVGNGSDVTTSFNWVIVAANVYGSTGIL